MNRSVGRTRAAGCVNLVDFTDSFQRNGRNNKPRDKRRMVIVLLLGPGRLSPRRYGLLTFRVGSGAGAPRGE